MAPEYIIVPVEVAHREFLPVEEQSKRSKPEKKEKGGVSLAEAKEIMQEKDFMGPDELKAIYGVEIKDVPPILFSASELAEAKKRGEFLILRMDTLPNGKPATMQNFHEYFAEDFNVLFNATNEWELKSTFFTEEKPSISWALVSKDIIPSSSSVNYFEQTKAIAKHLQESVYKEAMPREYEEAIQEFEAWTNATFPGKTASEIQAELRGENWKKYAERLASLNINQLCRQNAVEALFDMIVYYKRNGERLLPGMYTWTKSRGSDGGLVHVGRFGAGGAVVSGWSPGLTSDVLGVLLSRTA